MANAKKVTASKPKVGGAIFRAPIGTALPTDATTALNTAFKNLGYVSDSGIVNSGEITVEKVKAWGGDVVLSAQTEKTDTFKLTLIEGLNADVLKAVRGATNVTSGTASETVVKVNSDEQVAASWVFEILHKGGAMKRICVPSGTITEIGDVSYTDGDPVGFEITITATPDESGYTHYEYNKEKEA